MGLSILSCSWNWCEEKSKMVSGMQKRSSSNRRFSITWCCVFYFWLGRRRTLQSGVRTCCWSQHLQPLHCMFRIVKAVWAGWIFRIDMTWRSVKGGVLGVNSFQYMSHFHHVPACPIKFNLLHHAAAFSKLKQLTSSDGVKNKLKDFRQRNLEARTWWW